MSAQAKQASIEWFKKNEPFIYKVAMKRIALENNQLSGWADIGASVGKVFSSLTETVSNIAPTYLQYQQQKKVMDMQMERAIQGLPPANVEDYTPAVKIEANVTPETEQAITRVAQQTIETGAQKMMPVILAGGGLLAFLLLRKKGR